MHLKYVFFSSHSPIDRGNIWQKVKRSDTRCKYSSTISFDRSVWLFYAQFSSLQWRIFQAVANFSFLLLHSRLKCVSHMGLLQNKLKHPHTHHAYKNKPNKKQIAIALHVSVGARLPVVTLLTFFCADWLHSLKLLALFYFPVEQLPRTHKLLTGIKVNVVWN